MKTSSATHPISNQGLVLRSAQNQMNYAQERNDHHHEDVWSSERRMENPMRFVPTSRSPSPISMNRNNHVSHREWLATILQEALDIIAEGVDFDCDDGAESGNQAC